MALYVPKVGLIRFLNEIVSDTLTLRLFSNNHTPAAGDTSANYTEVTGSGYAAVLLTFANWTTTSDNPAYTTYNSFVTFTFTGAPGDIYGYYITRASGEVVLAQLFPVAERPFAPINGSTVKIKPRITLDNVV